MEVDRLVGTYQWVRFLIFFGAGWFVGASISMAWFTVALKWHESSWRRIAGWVIGIFVTVGSALFVVRIMRDSIGSIEVFAWAFGLGFVAALSCAYIWYDASLRRAG